MRSKYTLYLSIGRTFLLLGWISLNSSALFSQEIKKEQRQKLESTAKIYREEAHKSKKTALGLAKKYNWITAKEFKNGRIISLRGVDKLGSPLYLTTYNNSYAAATTRTNSLYTNGGLGLNLSGSSAFLNGKLGIWDGGSVYPDHQEFAGGRILNKNASAAISSHATHVAGTMMAAGINPKAKGMAFGVSQLVGYDFDNDNSEMALESSNLLVSNHSYGFIAGWYYNETPDNNASARWEWYGNGSDFEDYKFGFYDNDAKRWDEICYLSPYYLPVKSAGNDKGASGPALNTSYYKLSQGKWTKFTRTNGQISDQDGYDLISLTGNAKNILTVGAVYGIINTPITAANIQIAPFSSCGPTDDGRIKPDLVAMGIGVTSTNSEGPTSYISENGTSMSSPNASGSLILLQEAYKQKNNLFMRSATLKGLALHTAEDAGRTGPDYIYGWGLLNTEKAAKLILNDQISSRIIENELIQNTPQSFPIISSGNGPLMATICWTDPAGIENTGGVVDEQSARLINDLDIRITDGNGTSFLPWVLDPANPANAATKGDNTRDNIEQILIENPVPGRNYTLTVSHKNTISSQKQQFSIILSGIGGTAYCTSNATQTADSKIIGFKLNNIDYNAISGVCTNYTDNTSQTIELEAGTAYPATLKLGTCGNNFDKAAKIFIDFNSNGSFNDAGEEVAQTQVVNGNAEINPTIQIPGTLNIDNFSLLRIVLTETDDLGNVNSCETYAKGETIDFRVKFIKASKEVALTAITNPIEGACANATQNISVRLKNNGSLSVSNIPITFRINKAGNLLNEFTQTFTGTIASLGEAPFSPSITFNAEAGATYNISAIASLTGDADLSNNEIAAELTISDPPGLSNAQLIQCSSSDTFSIGADNDGTTFWYKNQNDLTPVAYSFGNSPASYTNTGTALNTMYAGVNDFAGKVGPATNTVFSVDPNNAYLGGINPSVLVNTKVPVILESARLYIGSGGKITFTVSKVSTNVEVSAVTLAVSAGNRVYPLGLLLPEAGDYSISISYEDGATIFRNNVGVSGYPFKIGEIFSISGNTAKDETGADPNYYQKYYYYFYDLAVKSAGCISQERTAVNISTLNIPTITVNGALLSSSAATGNQWYYNGTAIPGATNPTYTTLQAGSYGLTVNAGTCSVKAESVIIGVNFPLPATNFAVSTLSESCKTLNNGEINITAAKSLYYTAVLTANGTTLNYNFVDALKISKLSAGTYKLCLMAEGNSDYKICYDLVIKEPRDLSVYSQTDLVTNTLNLQMEGSSTYEVVLNGETTITSANQVSLALKNGANTLKITTGQECQGIYQKTIYASDKVLLFPNPFEDLLNITIGNNESLTALITINDNSGQVVYKQNHDIVNGNLQLNLSKLNSGIYFIKLVTTDSEIINKILKK